MIRLIILMLKGGLRIMVDIYVALIVNHRRTIDQVPVQLKTEVLADLAALGLDGYGNPLPSEG
jgi:hypothetical protein